MRYVEVVFTLFNSGGGAAAPGGTSAAPMLELGVKAMCLTPSNPLLLFLSSIEEHIFLHETHQNAGFSLKIFEKKFDGAIPDPAAGGGPLLRHRFLIQPTLSHPQYFRRITGLITDDNRR